MPSQAEEKRQAAREVIDILHEISVILVRSNPTTWRHKTNAATEYKPQSNRDLPVRLAD